MVGVFFLRFIKMYLRYILLVIVVVLSGCSLKESINPDNTSDCVSDDQGESIHFEDSGKISTPCFPAFHSNELNVATWNLKLFPLNGDKTVSSLLEIITEFEADIIAVQEITDIAKFKGITCLSNDWVSYIADVRYDQEIGFFCKKSAFSNIGQPSKLFADNPYLFPREVVRLDVQYIDGTDITFLNVHLKCCGSDGSEEQERRKGASLEIHQYLKDSLANRSVILLGDFNDEILGISSPFKNLVLDTNYHFSDIVIEQSNSDLWSYPSWPSHLDHILTTTDLNKRLSSAQTILIDSCDNDYFTNISDHRPVLASFQF